MVPDTGAQVAAILNAAWMVRHYARGGRVSKASQLGLIVRNAFSSSDDFEPLLAAVVDGLRPHENPPF